MAPVEPPSTASATTPVAAIATSPSHAGSRQRVRGRSATRAIPTVAATITCAGWKKPPRHSTAPTATASATRELTSSTPLDRVISPVGPQGSPGWRVLVNGSDRCHDTKGSLMRLDRLVIGVPVLIGALAVGSAYGYGIGIRPSVRDTVYPVCAHNGVHFNKQGHANCGLHKGWSITSPTAPPAAGAPTSPPANTNGPGHPTHPTHPVHPTEPARPAHPAHPTHPTRPTKPTHTAPTSSHGNGTSHGHGHAYGHGKGGGNANTGGGKGHHGS